MFSEFFSDANFYRFLTDIDRDIAAQVLENGCPHCRGGVLHVANYPRKPRGLRDTFDENYRTRFSLCCSQEGCRRRCTPPSVRFLGRKVYLGIVIVLVSAITQGLTPHRRKLLIEQLDLCPQTLARWRQWWKERFSVSRCWQWVRGRFVPPVDTGHLPGSLLGRLMGNDLQQRLVHLLVVLLELTSLSCPALLSQSMRVQTHTQKM
jgi:hypothetical protein